MNNKKYKDERGTLFFPIKNNNFYSKECTISTNKLNVFRGIHINNFDKLVTCITGKILDIIINFDEKCEDYLIPKYYTLDPLTDNFQLLIPKNYGHCFLSLEENSTLVYHFNDFFSNENTKHINYLDPFLKIELPIENPIISEKDSELNFIKPIDYLIFGYTGFLGKNLINALENANKNYITSSLRLNEILQIEKIIKLYKPKYVINCAGLTGTPNIFWCDNNKTETIETNIIFQMTLVKICNENNVHLTTIGSGGIFNNDKFYDESDEGNYNNNFYSKTRIELENMIKYYKNVLYLRINYPISESISNKNLLTKLLTFNEINDVEISITYIDELFPILIDMIENKETGICNFVNNGSIYLSEILKIYNKLSITKKEIIISNKQNNDRSYAKLSIGLLKKYNIRNINNAIENCVINYIKNQN
uniref:RmlD-like substrate binding domain-containing protein n=1 Tax=viral metagenome TaxID=1070528 RepID=A0A6C0KWB7_9ZZZZ